MWGARDRAPPSPVALDGVVDAAADDVTTTGSAPGCADAQASTPRIVLFDFDGVLVHGDLFGQFLRQRLKLQPWRLLLALPVLPVIALLGLLPPGRPLAIGFFIRLGLVGSRLSRLRAEMDRWARLRARLPGVAVRDGVLALRRHVASGDRVLIVTGCDETLAASLLAEIALADVDVLGSRLGSGWLGATLHCHNVGRRKLASLSKRGIAAPWASAYSDSSRDTPLLMGAVDPVLVNADVALCRRMERRLGRPLRRVSWR